MLSCYLREVFIKTTALSLDLRLIHFFDHILLRDDCSPCLHHRLRLWRCTLKFYWLLESVTLLHPLQPGFSLRVKNWLSPSLHCQEEWITDTLFGALMLDALKLLNGPKYSPNWAWGMLTIFLTTTYEHLIMLLWINQCSCLLSVCKWNPSGYADCFCVCLLDDSRFSPQMNPATLTMFKRSPQCLLSYELLRVLLSQVYNNTWALRSSHLYLFQVQPVSHDKECLKEALLLLSSSY